MSVDKGGTKQVIGPREELVIRAKDQIEIKEEVSFKENVFIVVGLDTARQIVSSCRRVEGKGNRVIQEMRTPFQVLIA